MSRLVETVRLENGILLNLRFHNARMIRSLYEVFGIKNEVDLAKIVTVPDFASTGIYKCRIIYDERNIKVEFAPYTIRPVRSVRLVFDDNIQYQFKFTDRENINRLYESRGRYDDILIIKDGFVTDTSYANVIFKNSLGNWVTPDTYLLPGTRRTSLIHQGLIKEVRISADDIKKYSGIKLINAMIGIEDTETIPVEMINTI